MNRKEFINNFCKERTSKICMILILILYSLFGTSNYVYGYISSANYGGSENGDFLLMLILCEIYLLWKLINQYKKHTKYKKMKTEECNALITSFDGYERAFFSRFYKYSYTYIVNNRAYSRKDCRLSGVHNKGDKIKILYNTDDIEDSITVEEYEKTSLKHRMIYVLFFACLFAIGLVGYLS